MLVARVARRSHEIAQRSHRDHTEIAQRSQQIASCRECRKVSWKSSMSFFAIAMRQLLVPKPGQSYDRCVRLYCKWLSPLKYSNRWGAGRGHHAPLPGMLPANQTACLARAPLLKQPPGLLMRGALLSSGSERWSSGTSHFCSGAMSSPKHSASMARSRNSG